MKNKTETQDTFLANMLRTEQKNKVTDWMSNELKETVTDLQKRPSRGRRVRETNKSENDRTE